MPRGTSICMLAVCVVLMDSTKFAHAQQEIGLRPSVSGAFDFGSQDNPFGTGAADDIDGTSRSEDDADLDDELPPPPQAGNAAVSNDQAFIDSALLPPPPPGGIAPRTGQQPAPDARSQLVREEQPGISATPVDPFEPLGLRLGAFVAYSSLDVMGTYSDNIRQSSSAEQHDFGLRLAPELRVESDWIRHAYSLNAAGEFTFYGKNTDVDEQDALLTGNLRLDMRRTTTLEFTSDYELSQTAPSSSEVPDNASGKRTDQEFGFTAQLSHRVNRLIVALTAGARSFLFDDVALAGGGQEDNADRN